MLCGNVGARTFWLLKGKASAAAVGKKANKSIIHNPIDHRVYRPTYDLIQANS